MLASAAPFGPVATLTLSAWALIIIGCLAAFYSGFGRPARASVTCTRRSARDCCGFTAYAVGYGQDNGLLFGRADRLLCCYLDCFGLRSLQIGCLGLKPCVPTRRALLLKQEASQAPRCSAASRLRRGGTIDWAKQLEKTGNYHVRFTTIQTNKTAHPSQNVF